jgi:alkylation response protein AidB-like acyl-CoA dehydrogenase
MNFAETDEQRMLRAQAREFLEDRYPIERVAAIADGEGFEKPAWREIAGLGWTGISAPEQVGGAGLGFFEEAVVIEELGRALVPGPFFSTVVLALPALGTAPDLARRIVAGEIIATLAWAGPGGEFDTTRFPTGVGRGEDRAHLYGSTWFVPDLALADLAVVAGWGPGGPGLWAVPLDQERVSRNDLPTLDTTRRLGSLFVEGAQGRLLAEGGEAEAMLEWIRDRALAALAVEAVGVASTALDLAAAYARTRQQFGRPIGTFQAVSQQLADAYAETELARSLALWAAALVAEGSPEASRAAAAAKALAAEAAVRTCERAIQVHGGIGFTWEHPLHRFYKRAEWIQAYMGWPTEQRERVARALLDRPGEGPERS